MKELLADKKIQRLIKRFTISLVVGLVVILVIIPGVRDSEFSKLKKYDNENAEGQALKKKQQMLDKWQYDMRGGIESAEAKIYRVGDFTTNLRGSTKKLILNLSLQYSHDDVPTELKSKNPMIRNAVISTCSDAQYLQSRHGKDLLKENLKRDLNKIISDGEITDVYFNRFLIQ